MKTSLKTTFLLFFLIGIALNTFCQSWQVQNSGTTNTLRHVHFVNANTGWVVGHSGTILKTTNGGNSWTKLPFSSTFATLIGCYFISETTGWIGGDIGVYKTIDGGNTWTPQSGPTGITKLWFINATTGWAVGGVDGSSPYYGDIYKTTDGGSSWTKTTSNTWARFYGIQFIDANTGWAYAEINGLLVGTTDGGNSWNILQNNSTNLIRGIYFLDKNNGWFAGRSSSSGLSMKTINGGATWSNIAGQLNYGLASIQMISDKIGWATSGPAIMKTIDGGVTWNSDFVGTVNLGSSSMFFKDPNHGWAVGEGGTILAYTNNLNAISEITFKKRILNVNSNSLNVNSSASYDLENSCFVALSIYNVNGKVLESIVNSWQPVGSYSVSLNSTKLTHGIYFLKIFAGEYSETVKLILK